MTWTWCPWCWTRTNNERIGTNWKCSSCNKLHPAAKEK